MIAFEKDVTPLPLGGGITRRVMSRGGGMMAVEVDFTPGAVGEIHSHPHEQITYCASGCFRLTMDGRETLIRGGDTYYCAPHVPHGVLCLEAGRLVDVFTPQREDFLPQEK